MIVYLHMHKCAGTSVVRAAQASGLRLPAVHRNGNLLNDQDKPLKYRGMARAEFGALIRQMIDQDGITALDFGRGDDPYKRLWVEQRAQRIGIVLANPRTINGLIIILRHAVGGLRRRIRGLQPAGDASPGSDRTFSVQYEPALL